MTMTQLLRAAEQLPPKQRSRLVARLSAPHAGVRPRQRRWTPDRQRQGLDMLLALAGSAPSRYRDVSADKYKHLAAAYRPRP